MSQRVCLVPRLQGVGGMVSFQGRLAQGLQARGIQATYDLDDYPYSAVLVVGGTRQLGGLWRARRRGIPILQRLDGRNWLHRVARKGRSGSGGLRHFLRSEYGNWLLQIIRARLAHRVVYQSEFARGWWERAAGPTPVPNRVIHNGVNLDLYTPEGTRHLPGRSAGDPWRMLLVEGSLMGGYELGLDHALQLAEHLQADHQLAVELLVAGRASAELQAAAGRNTRVPVRWLGLMPQEQIPAVDRSADFLFSGDLNPACPNSVIEALACGLPVAAYATGALSELVDPASGQVVPYGGDPWVLDPPDVSALAEAVVRMLASEAAFRIAARRRAEACFDQEAMVAAYLQALLED